MLLEKEPTSQGFQDQSYSRRACAIKAQVACPHREGDRDVAISVPSRCKNDMARGSLTGIFELLPSERHSYFGTQVDSIPHHRDL